MRALATALIIGSCVVFLPAEVRADRWTSPRPSIHATGEFAFKVVPHRFDAPTPAHGVLFTLNDDGSERVVWKEDLVNVPLSIHMSSDGQYVATINSHGNVGGKHSVVIYGPKGAIVADYALGDLLSEEEISTKVRKTVSSRWWTDGADLGIRQEYSRLVITLSWGRTINIDLATGQFEEPEAE